MLCETNCGKYLCSRNNPNANVPPKRREQLPLCWSVTSWRLRNKGQPSCRHAPASPPRQSEFHLRSELRWTGCPWRRSSRCPGETGRIKFGVSPGHRAEPSPPAEQATTADAAKIGSLPLKNSGLNRAQVKTCFGCGANRSDR